MKVARTSICLRVPLFPASQRGTQAPAGCSLEEKKGPWESNILFTLHVLPVFFPVAHLQ